MKNNLSNNLNKLLGTYGERALLAEYVSVDPSAVTKWVQGSANPKFNNLRKIAKYFDISVDDLID